MRLKIAIPLLLAGGFALLLPFLFRPNNVTKQFSQNMAASMPTVASEKNISNSSLPTPIQTQQTQSASDSAVMSQSADADDFETYVANRTEELRQLAMTD